MRLDPHKAEDIVTLVRRQYPNWTGFSDPEFLENEVTYKQCPL